MCGIGGIVWHHQNTRNDSLRFKMSEAMSHRGPDADGYYSDEGVSLVHRRLAIIDLSEAGNQPFIDPSGRFVLIYNGEMYNYQEVKHLFPDYPYKSASDTEV